MAFISPITKVFNRTSSFSRKAITANPYSYITAKMSLRADLDHVALDCRERDKVHAFYRDVLKFEHMQMPDAPFPSVRVSDVTILDFMKSDKSLGLSGGNHMCFSITKDDMEDLKKRLVDAGIKIGKERLLGGAKGRGWSIYITDPEDNKLEFRYYD